MSPTPEHWNGERLGRDPFGFLSHRRRVRLSSATANRVRPDRARRTRVGKEPKSHQWSVARNLFECNTEIAVKSCRVTAKKFPFDTSLSRGFITYYKQWFVTCQNAEWDGKRLPSLPEILIFCGLSRANSELPWTGNDTGRERKGHWKVQINLGVTEVRTDRLDLCRTCSFYWGSCICCVHLRCILCNLSTMTKNAPKMNSTFVGKFITHN